MLCCVLVYFSFCVRSYQETAVQASRDGADRRRYPSGPTMVSLPRRLVPGGEREGWQRVASIVHKLGRPRRKLLGPPPTTRVALLGVFFFIGFNAVIISQRWGLQKLHLLNLLSSLDWQAPRTEPIIFFNSQNRETDECFSKIKWKSWWVFLILSRSYKW